MKRRLRTLFYGLTHEHAPGKLETLNKLPDDFELVTIVDDRSSTRGWFQNFGPVLPEGVRVVEEPPAGGLPEALAEDIDVAFVEVANGRLMEIAAQLLARGIPVHCDKPCGEAAEPYRTLLGECRDRNLPFQIGYMYRGNPAVRWLWNFVLAGKLGEVKFIEADMNHDYQDDAPGYRDYLAQFRGGIFYNLGCHLIDLVLPMTKGEPEIVAKNLGVEEGAVLLDFAGTGVLLRTADHRPGGILCRRLRIDGTLGTIDLCPIERFDGGELKLRLTGRAAASFAAADAREAGLCRVAGAGDDEIVLDFGVQTDRYADQLLALAAVVRGDRPNDQDYDRDLRTHDILLKTI